MSDLVEFLHARLNEDEHAARAAASVTWTARKGMHDFSDGSGLAEMVVLSDSEGTLIVNDLDGEFTADDLMHIARHDPARALREVEAKRQTIDRLVAAMEEDYAPWNEDILIVMASVYADHPDYREEWRP